MEPEVAATVSSQAVGSSVQDKIATVDLSALTEQEQCQVRSLLTLKSTVVSSELMREI